MADTKEETAQEQTKSKGGMKVIIIVAVAMLLEAGIIIGAAIITRTPEVQANYIEASEDNPDLIEEVQVLSARMSNNKQGVPYLYETEVYIQVKRRYKADVTSLLEQNTARIKTEISTLWRQAEPRFFEEPQLNTLSRQVETKLRDIIPDDPESGEPRFESVLIPVLRGLPNY
ncbi:MAG: hypothetical protein D8M59_12260 [Planctomycetes bacterium]|nr:hypothetical protein [Planctomycetota bacterium]